MLKVEVEECDWYLVCEEACVCGRFEEKLKGEVEGKCRRWWDEERPVGDL